MQTPSAYILIIISILTINYFLNNKDFKNLKFFIFGCISCICFFIIFLYWTKTPIISFLYQYILFPLTIGEGRITSKEIAYISLIDQLNIKRLLGEFKFIHLFLIPLIFFSFKIFKKKNDNINILNFSIIFSSFAFFFNQLITANQIYIFSLIPLLAASLHVNLQILKVDKKIFYLIIFIVIFATAKFHERFNIDRKFLDIENLDKSNAIKANTITFKATKEI